MSDSVDIKQAADRLQLALKSLETSLQPILDKVTRLEREVEEGKSFKTDRAALAASLDTAKARDAEFKVREAEFSALAEETTAELDAVIQQVQDALTLDTQNSSGQ